MTKLLNTSTRAQLFLSFGLIVALLLILVTFGIAGFHQLQESKRQLHDVELGSVRALNRFQASEYEARSLVLTAILTDENRQRHLAEVQSLTTQSRQSLEILRTLLANRPRELGRVNHLQATHEELIASRDGQIIPAILRNDLETAVALMIEGPQMERVAQIDVVAAELLEDFRERAAEMNTRTEQNADRTIGLFIAIAAISVLGSSLLAFFISSFISRQLAALSSAAERIAEGDLTLDIPPTRRTDEIGVLTTSFRAMLNSLRDFNREIHEGINVLASSSSEILAATSQIATGVSETAASVNQTTSTLEQSRQTAKLVSEKAGGVLEVSQRVSRSSTDGRKKVDEAVHEMQVIKEHMENIGQNIMRLHENSQAIGDIIASVNDIAEQSNILAVNAAIEAAKAGEHGRGFGVVAHEMKSLALQSKQATIHVRSILGEIQQTANSTVMATERGNKVVESGVERSRAAGEAIRRMAESITAASQAAMQISASSNEQLIGMDQVASAMENITQASHQNASGTKQAEISARNLHELGQRLKELIARFRVH